MAAAVRIVVWVLSGWLIGVGLPDDIVTEFVNDPKVVLSIRVGMEAALGAAGLIVAWLWRKASIKFGWSR